MLLLLILLLLYLLLLLLLLLLLKANVHDEVLDLLVAVGVLGGGGGQRHGGRWQGAQLLLKLEPVLTRRNRVKVLLREAQLSTTITTDAAA